MSRHDAGWDTSSDDVARDLGGASDTSTPDVEERDPTPWWSPEGVRSEQLTVWLRGREYRGWESSSGVFPSPEGGTRVFVNSVLARALEAQEPSFPVGSMAVRELYLDDLRTPKAFNLLVKMEDGPEPRPEQWHWFELPADGVSPATTDERGAAVCVGCHSAPEHVTDSIQSRWPLR